MALVRCAAERGLTHLAVTDHETIDGALRAAEAAEAAEAGTADAGPAGIRVIVGSEVLTTEGDLIFLFLRHAIPRGLSASEAIDAGREQGALVGIPHPFDRSRRSLLRDPANEALVARVDWVETWNGRVTREIVNEQAAQLARRLGKPGVGVTDAHALLEIGAAWTAMRGDPSTPEGLREALRGPLEIAVREPRPPVSQRARLLGPARRRLGMAK